MSPWGMAPWENDTAADWFGNVMQKSNLPRIIESTLALETEEHHEEIRAAAYVLLSLGHIFIWPVERLDAHMTLAIQKLREIASMEIYTESDFAPVIEKEITELESRRTKPTGG